MISIFKTVFIHILFLSLMSCTDTKPINGIAGIESFKLSHDELNQMTVSKKETDRNKKLSKKRLEAYTQRNAMASLIVKNKLIDLPSLRAELQHKRNELIIKKYFDLFVEEETSEMVIKQYYDDHIEDYTSKKAHVAQIIRVVSANVESTSQENVLNKMHSILNKIEEGLSFNEAIKKYSEYKKANIKRHTLSWLKSASDPELFKELSAIEVDSITSPILTAQGYKVIKLLEPIEITTLSYDQAKNKIKYQMKYTLKLNELNRLKELAKMEIKVLIK